MHRSCGPSIRCEGNFFGKPEVYGAESPQALSARGTPSNMPSCLPRSRTATLIAYELEKLERVRPRNLYLRPGSGGSCPSTGIPTALIRHLRGIAKQREVWVICV